jgi:hypothetical protein
MRPLRPLLLALAVALTTTSLSAQNWRDELKEIDNDLRTQHYGHARKWSIKMINSMCDHLGTGPDSMYTLALTVAYRSMAEAGLQKTDEAHWYWHVATALYPKLADQDWKPYGAVGEWFAAQKTSDSPAQELPPAVVIKRSEPKCPLSAVMGGYYQPVTVAATITSAGTASCPRLVSSTNAPTLAYTAFEALKEFQFQPGSAQYQVTVNFQPPAQ